MVSKPSGGPTNAVLEIGGRPPEDFETIVRRYVAQSPDTQRTPTSLLKAVWSFAQILITPVPDVDGYERSQHHPEVTQAVYASEFADWLKSHRLEGAFSVMT